MQRHADEDLRETVESIDTAPVEQAEKRAGQRPEQGRGESADQGELADGAARPDIVVSDGDGTTADPGFSRWVIAALTRLGYRVAYNTPYRGGDLVRHFGRPAERRHSVQIELNQALYLNESHGEKHDGFSTLQSQLGQFAAALAAYAEQHSEEV